MPRGGRRPGAGAPRGNTNALRTGNRSQRMREAWFILNLLIARNDEARLRAILIALDEAGLLGRNVTTRANMPRIIKVIHPLLIDYLHPAVNQDQSTTIEPHPTRPVSPRAPAAAFAPAESAPPAHTAATTLSTQIDEKTNHNQSRGDAC